jgi:4-diphosphocytidyl-2-C-methyl-D-erythritol kinase
MAASAGDALYADASASVEPAPAKINLALHVTGRRGDGYHSLETLVVFADQGDLIRAAEESSGGAIKVEAEGPFGAGLSEALKTGDNIVLKAAQAMNLRRFGREGLRLVVEKRLPLASGRGGGSADAAATLRLLNRLNGGGDERGLAGIAARLGADVPMCLVSEPLLARGIGDRLERVAGMPAVPLVLVNPGVELSTAKVFERLRRADDQPMPDLPRRRFNSIFELVIWLRQTWNSLEAPAQAEDKSIKLALAALRADPDCLFARMTGSGPTCFGIFATPAAAQRAAIRLRVGRPEWWITACVTGAS